MAAKRSHRLAAILNVQEFDPEAVQRTWQADYSEGKLNEGLQKHWCQYVPLVYTLKSDVDPLREERKARRLLFRPMEAFICGSDPDRVLRELKDRDHPPQVCGRVFKNGEPTYSCRDCGMDPTCVLCIDCFQQSTHKQHRYKMSTSNGGGYCDCGDVEAWKNDAYCDIHRRGLERADKKDPVEMLPADLRQRARDLFLCVIRYAVEMLMWPHCDVLPEGLKTPQMTNEYATILFNDEVHTYEQVINTLQRAVSCTQKEAVDFATTVDREGRSCVKTGTFTDCENARLIIEKNTSRLGGKPLKVLVMHITVVAHQMLAQKILAWLQQVISNSDGLRMLFCKLSLQKLEGESASLVEKMMLADIQLWKSARILSHQLFMAGVLMDQECKKLFAILFTKIYPQLMAGFINDDHDHSVCAVSESVQIFTIPTLHYPALMQDFIRDDHFRSVSTTSCSVQIFTVPTLVRLLITEHNLLQVIVNTFLGQCQAKKNAEGKFAFERNERNQSFKRAQYMLFDLKYALMCRPNADEWNCALRTNFLNGFGALLDLLKCMQGMDSVKREIGTHIEFEPEWEGAFNLQLKLSDNIAIIQQWCASDRDVLTASFIRTIDALVSTWSHVKEKKTETIEVASHSAKCIKYDVAFEKVSIHIPLSRLLAGLYPLLNVLNISLKDIHTRDTRLKMYELMEPVLRCQVMIAQTQAGMWRRNGYSLLNQIYFYLNVRCRTEMYDKDIVMLQAAAAMLDPNEFLIHCINKFDLVKWAKADYDTMKLNPTSDHLRQVVTMAEEFLTLLIIILGERYVEGVGDVSPTDAIKREIVHQLCLQPMPHSELVKSLPEDPNHETGIESVVAEVALFKKPTDSSKGMYELKEECYKMYNPYFYHYSRADQSKSEESQRKKRKTENKDQALSPPVPPAFSNEFKPIVSLLESDVLVYLIQLILKRTTAQRSRSWSEMQFEKVLHLIGLALHEDERTFALGDMSFKFIAKASKGEDNILSLLEGLSGHANITHDAQRDLLTWVLKLFRERCKKRDESFAMDTSETDAPSKNGAAEAERRRRMELAAKRRARIMAQMSKMQKDFIKENAELFKSTSTDLQQSGTDADVSSEPMEDDGLGQPLAIGVKRSAAAAVTAARQICILCQEEQDILHNERAMVLAAFVQKSTVISQKRGHVIDKPEEYDPLFQLSSLYQGIHTCTCGHVMHADCWQRFYDAIVARERRRTLRFRQSFSYDIEKMEFLCPLCETLSNTVIPLVPHLSTLLNGRGKEPIDLSLNDWLDGVKKTVSASIREKWDQDAEEESFLFVPCPLSSITKMMADSVAKNFQLLFEYVHLDSSATFSDSLTAMIRKFSTDIYTIGLGLDPNAQNTRVPILVWCTCAYTIMVTEQCLRDEGKPLFGALPTRQSDCLSALVRFAAVSNQVIQPDVIKHHCVNLLSALVLESASNRLQETPCILDLELFHTLVQLCLALPVLYADDDASGTAKPLTRIPTGGLNDHHILQLVLTAHIVQLLLQADLSESESMEVEESDGEGEALVEIYVQLKRNCGTCTENMEKPSPWLLSSYIREAVLPFLRCAAIFFHYLTGVRPPAQLHERRSDELDILCDYLSMPKQLSTLFDDRHGDIMKSLVESWSSDATVKRLLTGSKSGLPQLPVLVNQLVPLPADYSQLINKASTFTCPKSDGDDSRAPTMCLVCGQMLCSQSYCCQTELENMTVGAATAHAHTCGAGTAILLRVRDCQVVLLNGRTKGCFFPPPYLDDYGETDQGLKRGNPLHLCPERYRKLQKLWLSHGIPEEIAHCLESNANLLSIDWQHL